MESQGSSHERLSARLLLWRHRAPLAIALVVLSSACQSSATTSVSPSPLAKCQLTATTDEAPIPAAGGAGTIAVATAAECAWTVTTTAAWISALTPAGGQGSGQVTFQVAPNPAGATRHGEVLLNDSTARLTQAGAPCLIEIAPLSQNLPATGGAGTVSVTTLPGCGWTVTSDASWLSATADDGEGSGTVRFVATAHQGPARTGTLTIGGQRFVVTQQAPAAEPCTFAVQPAAIAIEAAGGMTTVAVQAGASCLWTATSGAPWVTVRAPGEGTGNGSVSVSVATNTGSARTGTLAIAGRTVTITQAGAPCLIEIAPLSQNLPATGGAGTVSVTTLPGCRWTVTSDASWLSATADDGEGSGTVRFVATAHQGPARTGTLTIGGQRFVVTQEAPAAEPCTFAVQPTAIAIEAAGGMTTVAVQAGASCSWTATSSAGWVAVGEPGEGTGNGSLSVSVAANTGSARTGTLTIAGRTVTITQAGSCASTISPTSQTVTAVEGAASPVTVTSPAGCSWTATTTASWIAITSGAAGSGTGTVSFTVAANPGPARTDTLQIAGQTHTVNQASGCSVSIAPESASPSAMGGPGAPIAVTAGPGCDWAATTATPWITVTSGSSGTGNGSVGYTVGVNTGAAREGTISIAARTFTVSQVAACAFDIEPRSARVDEDGGRLDSVAVTASDGCTWTAASNVPWITVMAGATGTGNGSVTFRVSRNSTDSERVGTLTIAGHTFTVTQDGD
jgi:antitoxin (DNA-binding transcriptional repressor) of toxin-antitoxin stability system